MIPGDLATRIRQLTDNNTQPTSAVQKIPGNLPEFSLGQRFTAIIQSALPDGIFQALVAGKTVTLALPQSVKSGDVLELIATGQHDNSVLARIVPQDVEGNDAPQSTLSQTGRLISQLLTGRFGDGKATPLARGEPLLPAPTRDTNQLSSRLQQAVSESGLFYESHLKNWAEGQTALASLMREPQSQFMPGKTLPNSGPWASVANPETDIPTPASSMPTESLAALSTALADVDNSLSKGLLAPQTEESNPDTASTATNPSSNSASQNANGNSPAQPAALAAEAKLAQYEAMQPRATSLTDATSQTGRDIGANTSAHVSQSTTPQPIPEALMPLIYQQLETMATHQMQWQFQPWPGTNVEWDVVDPEQNNGNTEEDQASSCRSSLRMHLPQLGEVDAVLVMTPQGLSIRLDAESGASAQRMRAAGSRLLTALEGAGLSVNSLSVTEHASA